MRMTIAIDDRDLTEIQKATGIRKKSPAVQKAVYDYLHAIARRRFLQRVCEGKTDYGTRNEDLEAAGTYDAAGQHDAD